MTDNTHITTETGSAAGNNIPVPILSAENVIKDAHELQQQLRREAFESNKILKGMKDAHLGHISWIADLTHKDLKRQERALVEIQQKYGKEFNGRTIADARSFVNAQLETLTKEIYIKYRGTKDAMPVIAAAEQNKAPVMETHRNRTKQKAASSSKKTVEELAEEAEPGFFTRNLFKHAENLSGYLDKRTVGEKLGIAAGGIVIGGMMMHAGGRWLFNGLEGKEQSFSRQDDNSITMAMKPMNPTKRVASILGGTLAGATGVAAEFVGIFSLYKMLIGY